MTRVSDSPVCPVFDPRSLGVEMAPVLAGLMRWVECESPTLDPAAVNRMIDMASADLQAAGAQVERIPNRPGLGDSVIGHFPHPRAGEPGVLIMGHLDTVHPVGTLAALPCRREDDRCYGPGINDMKAGNFLSLWAAKTLHAAGISTPLPVSILYTGDEEIGSPGTRAMIESIAQRYKYILIPEPARPDGSVVVGRHEIRRFTLRAHGKPTHAGNTPESGRSAIRQMAEKIIEIENLSTPAAMMTVGIVHGGLWSNCVATTCEAEMIMVVREPGARDERIAALMALAHDSSDGGVPTGFSITPLLQRPRWEPTPASQALYETARAVAESLDMPLPSLISGGGSDGNFTGALGLATLDGLGARGQEHHTLNEHIFVDSLVPRTELMMGLLTRLS